MNYQQFRDIWHSSLEAIHLHIPYPLGPIEKIDLHNMSRSYELIVPFGTQPRFEPFHCVVSIVWVWDALLSARCATNEEDMLMTLYGEHGLNEDTETSSLRIDVNLTASVPYGSNYPMPAKSQ